jgi:hypothetical protein
MTEVLVGVLLVTVLVLVYLLISYSKWTMESAQNMLKALTEKKALELAVERSIVSDSGELAGVVRDLKKQVAAMDISIGHIFQQTLQATGRPGNRTVRRDERQAGEELPPFPGAGPSTVKLPEPPPGEGLGFEPLENQAPVHAKPRPVPELGEPS